MYVTASMFVKLFKRFFPVRKTIMNKGWLCRFWIQQTLIISCSTGCTIHSIFWCVHTYPRVSFVPTTLNRSAMRLLRLLQYDCVLCKLSIKGWWGVLTSEQHWHSHELLVAVDVSFEYCVSSVSLSLSCWDSASSSGPKGWLRNLILLSYEKTAELFTESQSET